MVSARAECLLLILLILMWRVQSSFVVEVTLEAVSATWLPKRHRDGDLRLDAQCALERLQRSETFAQACAR